MGMEEYKLEAHPVSKKEAIIQQRRCIRGPCNTVRTEP